jgi:hypothetical protein
LRFFRKPYWLVFPPFCLKATIPELILSSKKLLEVVEMIETSITNETSNRPQVHLACGGIYLACDGHSSVEKKCKIFLNI